MPQVPMDPPPFMLAPLSMMDAEYQLWRNGIPYAQQLFDDLGYDEFSETCLMSFFPIEVCIFSLSFFHSLHLTYVTYDDAQYGDHVRMCLVVLHVALLTLPTCLG